MNKDINQQAAQRETERERDREGEGGEERRTNKEQNIHVYETTYRTHLCIRNVNMQYAVYYKLAIFCHFAVNLSIDISPCGGGGYGGLGNQ